MATRYGRRTASGIFEYHDTAESLNQAVRRENGAARAGLFGLAGLLIGGVLSFVLVTKFGDLPKWLRFGAVIMGAGIGAYVLAKLSDLLWNLIVIAMFVTLVGSIGSCIWRAL